MVCIEAPCPHEQRVALAWCGTFHGTSGTFQGGLGATTHFALFVPSAGMESTPQGTGQSGPAAMDPGVSAIRVGPGGVPLQARSPDAPAAPEDRRRWKFVGAAVLFFAVIAIIIGVTASQGDDEDEDSGASADSSPFATAESELLVDGISVEQIQRAVVQEAIAASIIRSFLESDIVVTEVRCGRWKETRLSRGEGVC